MASNGLFVSGIAAVALDVLCLGSEAHSHNDLHDLHGHHHHHGSSKKQKSYDRGYRKGYKHAFRSTGTSWVRVVSYLPSRLSPGKPTRCGVTPPLLDEYWSQRPLLKNQRIQIRMKGWLLLEL